MRFDDYSCRRCGRDQPRGPENDFTYMEDVETVYVVCRACLTDDEQMEHRLNAILFDIEHGLQEQEEE